MATYIILDTQNLFMRVRFGIKAPDIDSQVGMALHIILNSVKKVWNGFDATHTVFCLEGRSWRKDVYPPYKANRKAAQLARSPKEVEEDTVFFEIMDQFVQFLRSKTNCTVLQHPNAEADDMIARWIQLHPEDQHVIISTDGDFQQLISANVKIYNGIAGLLYTHEGVYDKDGNLAQGKKNQPIEVPKPEWLLFEKCMRGDASDNVMSAFPGVRTKKLLEVFEDRNNKGYVWNNVMLSKWNDHDGIEHRVRDDYERNRLLIDLTMQPPDLIDKFDARMIDSVNQPPKTQVGVSLMRFCNLHGLVRIEKQTAEYSPCFSAAYRGPLILETDDDQIQEIEG
jgi:5'-3' exonuclease